MENISKHISYSEATDSPTGKAKGINNHPGQKELAAMKLLAEKVFEPLREHFAKPIKINSFYRSEALNKAVGGAATSQHLYGEAMDIEGTGGITNAQLFAWIVTNLDFDQCIWEGGTDKEPAWVHVSYSAIRNRKQILQMTKVNGKSVYNEIKL